MKVAKAPYGPKKKIIDQSERKNQTHMNQTAHMQNKPIYHKLRHMDKGLGNTWQLT